jgi:hypothetical protein
MAARRDGGYALVAAVTAVAAFAYIAFEALALGQGGVALLAGRMEQARLAAAGDGGIAMAIHGLATEDRGDRWSIDGRPRDVDLDDIHLTIVVDDERGKAPLGGLNDSQARALFQGAGASGDRLDALVTEFRQWQTQDTLVPKGPAGPEEAAAPPIRHGPFATVGELSGLRDMDAALLARIAPAVTVFFEESGPFEPKYASPLALATMEAMGGADAQSLAAQSDIVRQAPEEELPDDHLVGRTLTIRVTARARDGAHTHRMAIVELTGDKTTPYWVRYVE